MNKCLPHCCGFTFLLLFLMLSAAVGCTQNAPEQAATTDSTSTPAIIETVARASPSDRVPRISIEEFKKKMDSRADYVLIDNRSADEFKVDHIKGAVNITLAQILDGDYILPAGSLQSKEYILYCS